MVAISSRSHQDSGRSVRSLTGFPGRIAATRFLPHEWPTICAGAVEPPGSLTNHGQADVVPTRESLSLTLSPRGGFVPAYIVVETDIHDPEQYELYKRASPAAVAAGGGRFIARGGELAVLEGDWQPRRLVLLEFPDLEAAKRFYESPEYQEAKRLREGAAGLNMVAVEGLD